MAIGYAPTTMPRGMKPPRAMSPDQHFSALTAPDMGGMGLLPMNRPQTQQPLIPQMGGMGGMGGGENPWAPENVGHTGRHYLSQAGNAGFFDPMGSPAITAAIRRRALQTQFFDFLIYCEYRH